ncbi:hypothetical protein [Companilactobacillus mishanensis]|uniref:Uncharacterized protein n=1 Tax=Companilactobacillus mishanensis TaxID=2486008 RepID=A0A5P0ZIW5_9LACO|nr:hypothetical protein [Companilactobacillus mishanensis]MQS52978.1 hypothetical protein [Companilactobacillus mishanensis]
MGNIQEMKTYTNDDIEHTYSDGKTLYNDKRWGVPSYNWDIEHTQALTNMPLKELDTHLKMLLGAKLSMAQLRESYWQNIQRFKDTFIRGRNGLNKDYKEFVYLSRHPNEVAYKKEHDGKLPEPKEINYNNYIFSIVLMVVGLIMWIVFSKMSYGLSYALDQSIDLGRSIFGWAFWIGVLFCIAAWRGWKFSQPIASLINQNILRQRQNIIDADEEYCRTHHVSDEDLQEAFKYQSSLDAIISTYVNEMKLEQKTTDERLDGYFKIVLEHIVYLPPDQTRNMYHLLRVYETLLNGVPTWDQAIVYVGRGEQIEDAKTDIVNAIQHSASTIRSAIHGAQVSISGQINEMHSGLSGKMDNLNGNFSDLSQTTKIQSQNVEHWMEVQSANSKYQSELLNRIK